jgi:hypothetical protein
MPPLPPVTIATLPERSNGFDVMLVLFPFVVAGLVHGSSRPSTCSGTSGAKDVDARLRRQVYAVCVKQTAMAGHDDY